MSGTLVITAASDFLVSEIGLREGVLSRVAEYYRPLGLPTVMALSDGGVSKITEFGAILPEWLTVVEVPRSCKGALATAVFAIASLGLSRGNLHIAAGDTVFTKDSTLLGVQALAESGMDAGTIVFESDDPRYSFVAMDEQNRIRLVAEKTVISAIATSGNFFFNNVSEFMDASEWCFKNNENVGGNYFVSAALNYFVFKGRMVGSEEIESDCVIKRWPDFS